MTRSRVYHLHYCFFMAATGLQEANAFQPRNHRIISIECRNDSHHLRSRRSMLNRDSCDSTITEHITYTAEKGVSPLNLADNVRTMSRRLFFSQSTAAAVAVSTLSSNPEETVAAGTEDVFPPLIAASKVSDETFVETISGFFSGAALTTTKTFVKYPLDTATVRLQMPNTPYSMFNLLELFDGSFRGISLPLLANIPGGALFFAVKDATKSVCKQQGMPKWMTTCISVGVANFPYWLIRNPSEVVKTRQQISAGNETGFDALRAALSSGNSTRGLKDLYSGYWENIIYAYPADVFKFLAYEKLSSGRKNLPPAEAAIYGAISTAIAQFSTTPLDVVRNRIMAVPSNNVNETSEDEKVSYMGKFARLARKEGLEGLFAGASPRVGKAFLSGAIQFATYEETKKSIREAFALKGR